jgi:hypothetical protein
MCKFHVVDLFLESERYLSRLAARTEDVAHKWVAALAECGCEVRDVQGDSEAQPGASGLANVVGPGHRLIDCLPAHWDVQVHCLCMHHKCVSASIPNSLVWMVLHYGVKITMGWCLLAGGCLMETCCGLLDRQSRTPHLGS